MHVSLLQVFLLFDVVLETLKNAAFISGLQQIVPHEQNNTANPDPLGSVVVFVDTRLSYFGTCRIYIVDRWIVLHPFQEPDCSMSFFFSADISQQLRIDVACAPAIDQLHPLHFLVLVCFPKLEIRCGPHLDSIYIHIVFRCIQRLMDLWNKRYPRGRLGCSEESVTREIKRWLAGNNLETKHGHESKCSSIEINSIFCLIAMAKMFASGYSSSPICKVGIFACGSAMQTWILRVLRARWTESVDALWSRVTVSHIASWPSYGVGCDFEVSLSVVKHCEGCNQEGKKWSTSQWKCLKLVGLNHSKHVEKHHLNRATSTGILIFNKFPVWRFLELCLKGINPFWQFLRLVERSPALCGCRGR